MSASYKLRDVGKFKVGCHLPTRIVRLGLGIADSGICNSTDKPHKAVQPIDDVLQDTNDECLFMIFIDKKCLFIDGLFMIPIDDVLQDTNDVLQDTNRCGVNNS